MNITRSLTNQPPTDYQIERIEEVRALAIDLGKHIEAVVPNGRAKSLAITNLEQSVMWAVKAIVLGDDQ